MGATIESSRTMCVMMCEWVVGTLLTIDSFVVCLVEEMVWVYFLLDAD